MDKNVLDELREAMENVPFGNSQFQIEKFILDEPSPERQYRKALLQINQKLAALDECKFRRQRLEIDLEEIDDRIAKSKNKFEKQRLKIDKEEKELQLTKEVKLINDAIIEVETYYKVYSSLPKFTRKQFELSEYVYWERRLIADAERELLTTGRIDLGTLKSLNQINITPVRTEVGQIEFRKTEPMLIEEKL